MAAVVASLAGILAGCSLSVQSGSGGGGRGFVQDPAAEREFVGEGGDEQSTAVWVQARPAASLGITAAFAEGLTVKTDALKGVAAEAGHHAELLTVVPLSPAPAFGDVAAPKRSALKGSQTAAGGGKGRKAGKRVDIARHVSFDLSKMTEHEVTPYSEVYNGVHPRDFNFGKGLPAPFTHFVDPRAKPLPEWTGVDSDSEDEDDLVSRKRRAKARLALGVRSVPQHMWVLLCVVGFVVRAFGTTAIMEVLSDSAEGLHLKLA